MIGHMILRKHVDGEDILGLKVLGGQPLPNGRLGAIIDKVKRASIAELEGHIKPGRCHGILLIRLQPSQTTSLRVDRRRGHRMEWPIIARENRSRSPRNHQRESIRATGGIDRFTSDSRQSPSGSSLLATIPFANEASASHRY